MQAWLGQDSFEALEERSSFLKKRTKRLLFLRCGKIPAIASILEVAET
jgi:hypothetical protein